MPETDNDLKRTKKGPMPKSMKPTPELPSCQAVLLWETIQRKRLMYFKVTSYPIPYADETTTGD